MPVVGGCGCGGDGAHSYIVLLRRMDSSGCKSFQEKKWLRRPIGPSANVRNPSAVSECRTALVVSQQQIPSTIVVALNISGLWKGQSLTHTYCIMHTEYSSGGHLTLLQTKASHTNVNYSVYNSTQASAGYGHPNHPLA